MSGTDASAPGFSVEGCFPAEPGERGAGLPFLSECLSDGTAKLQAFGLGDDTCAGQVYYEIVTSFVTDWPSGPDRRYSEKNHSCYLIDGFYYR